MSIGTKIRNERTYQSLSQKQLAEKVGMSEPAVRNYELGNRTPSQKQIEMIANALHISPFALSEPDLESYYGMMHAFFYLENMIDLQPVEIEGQVYLSVPPTGAIYENIKQWHDTSIKQANGEMNDEEYKEWKDTFPEKVIYNKR